MVLTHCDWTLFTGGEPIICDIEPDGRIDSTHGFGSVKAIDDTIIEVKLDGHTFRLGRYSRGDYGNDNAGCFLMQSPPRDWRMMRGPYELGMWRDNMLRNEYRLPERFAPADIVVDIGAHVGSFAKACLDRGAGLVICFEPDGQNFEDLAANLKAYTDHSVLIRAAAWTTSGTKSFARPVGAEHTGGGSVVSAGESFGSVRTVDAPLTIATITDGPIRLLKLDCEGAEWELLRGDYFYANAQTIAMEWHENAPNADLARLRERLAAKYSTVDVVNNVAGLGWLFAS